MGFFGLRPPAVQGSILPRQANWSSAHDRASKARSPKTELFSRGSKGALEQASPSHTGWLAATAGPQRLPHQDWPESSSPGEKILQRS